MAFEDWCLAHSRVNSKRHKNVRMDDKIAFFQQLATLVNSGTPLLDALYMCADQNQSEVVRTALLDVAERVAGGSPLNVAMGEHRKLFPHHWTEVVQIGETTGNLGTVLGRLNVQIQETRETMRKLTGSLMYPIMLVTVCLGVLVILLWFVVPVFADMFKEMGSELPEMTQTVVAISDLFANYGLYGIAALAAAFGLLKWQLNNDDGRRRLGAAGLATPLVGDLMVQSAMYQFSSNIGLLLRSDVSILDSLNSLRSVFHSSPLYRDALSEVHHRVSSGTTLAESLVDSGLFPGMLTDMVRTGEESGQLVDVMEQIAPYYKEKMNTFIARLTKMIEPTIIVVMGVTIAFVMTSIYLPMFEMAGKVK